MTMHISGTSLDAQKRYADGTREIIKRFYAGEQQEPANLIVENGEVSPIVLNKSSPSSTLPRRMVRGMCDPLRRVRYSVPGSCECGSGQK